MIPNPSIEVQTSALDRPSVPAWFADVVIIARSLATKGLLDAFAQQSRLGRGRFGTEEPLDFLALLIGYAMSGERTLADFFERLAHARDSLHGPVWTPMPAPSLQLESLVFPMSLVPAREAVRTLFEKHSEASGWTSQSSGGLWDRQGPRYIVFDVDATRQAARQRALPCDPTLPAAQRRLDAVGAPGYTGRKRGEVVRTRTTARRDAYASMGRYLRHSRQWRLSC